jgi:quercetin dioxygenase-like cupin family protein
MLIEKNLSFAKLNITVYDFEFKGDELKAHSHKESATHISNCSRGSVLVITDEWSKTLVSGDIIEFFADQNHSIVALEDNSRVMNIPKYG